MGRSRRGERRLRRLANPGLPDPGPSDRRAAAIRPESGVKPTRREACSIDAIDLGGSDWSDSLGAQSSFSPMAWCKDKRGVSWQIAPRVLTEALAVGGAEAKRAFDATMA